MKNLAIKTFAVIFSVCLGQGVAFSQGNFQNLDFESANIPAGTHIPSELSANQAIPGWSGSSPIVYDFLGSGDSQVTIIDSNSGLAPLQGNYSVVLVGGTDTG